MPVIGVSGEGSRSRRTDAVNGNSEAAGNAFEGGIIWHLAEVVAVVMQNLPDQLPAQARAAHQIAGLPTSGVQLSLYEKSVFVGHTITFSLPVGFVYGFRMFLSTGSVPESVTSCQLEAQ